jgi:kynurenine 3-monooxygenase
MSGTPGRKVIIVGAGLVGSLLAVYLAHAGWSVRVYERRGDPRRKGYAGGRSINLALSARGLAGLRGVGFARDGGDLGLDRVVMQRDAIPMPGRMMHARDGALAFQPYSKDPRDAINAVSRGGLNLTLIHAAAECPGVELFFDHPCLDVDLAAPAATFQSPDGGAIRIEADLVIGSDGAFSAVRGMMQKTDRFDYSQSYLSHGYKELHIPPRASAVRAADAVGIAAREAFAMEPHALHIWPRPAPGRDEGGAMMIALPNMDGSFTCTLFWPFEGEHAFGPLERSNSREHITAFFEQHYADAVPLMPTLADDFLSNRTSSLVTVRCWPWQINGVVALIGDSAHAIVPFYGQGMNSGFEDCTALAACLREHPRDQRAALERYQSLRKPNADAIADMALDNFIEMRDKVADPAFLYRKKLEQAVHAAFADKVSPQYSLVSFSNVPYVEARRRGRELDAMLERVIVKLPRESFAALGESVWSAKARELAAVELAEG